MKTNEDRNRIMSELRSQGYNDQFDIWDEFDDDVDWSGNMDRETGYISGTHYYQWLETNNKDYRSNFYENWNEYITEYPENNTDKKFMVAGEIQTHYYECGH